MKLTTRTWLIAAVAPFALGVGVAAGCGPDGATAPPDHGPVRPPEGSGDYIFPTTAYTGYDGQSTFKVPLATNLTNVTWEIEDPTILSIDPTNAPESYAEFGETWALATTWKAGTTKVWANSGGKRVEATIVVSEYDRAVVAEGAKRYYTPDNPGGDREACVNCHGQLQGADHSPLEMEFFRDDEVLEAITDGKYPDGYVLQNVNHVWGLTDAERVGIVPYLRSLAPRGFF